MDMQSTGGYSPVWKVCRTWQRNPQRTFWSIVAKIVAKIWSPSHILQTCQSGLQPTFLRLAGFPPCGFSVARINPSSLQRSFNTIIIQIEILAENTILMKKGNRLPRAATTPLVGQLPLPLVPLFRRFQILLKISVVQKCSELAKNFKVPLTSKFFK